MMRMNEKGLRVAGVFCAVMTLHAATAFGASLNVTSATVREAGGTASVCVQLSSAGEKVAATQNNLVWDGNCASLVDKCEVNSAHGKQLMSNQPRSNELKAIVISLQDTNPIPDGDLYCCTFRLDLSNGGSCCAIGLQDLGSSDPDGHALGTAGRGGQICLASSGGTGGGLQGAGAQPQAPVSADLGSAAQQPAANVGQPAVQQGSAKPAAGSGSTVASGGTGGVSGGVGGVPGGVGGVPGGVGGIPGGQPQAAAQPGAALQPEAAVPGAAPAGEGGAPRAQAPAPGAPQQPMQAAAGQPTVAPTQAAAAAAPAAEQPAQAPAAPRHEAQAAKPAAPAHPTAVAKAAAPAAPPQSSSGCNCEITTSNPGFEGTGALAVIGILLWARRRRL